VVPIPNGAGVPASAVTASPIGAAGLLAARGGLLRAFGPGLAATVLVSMVVSLTLMPALLAVFGGSLFKLIAAAAGNFRDP
jgi:RND superfamily putative drug exporter